jgi:hypothetical protein
MVARRVRNRRGLHAAADVLSPSRGLSEEAQKGEKVFRTVSVRERGRVCKLLISGGRYWDRTSGPCRVKAVLYR